MSTERHRLLTLAASGAVGCLIIAYKLYATAGQEAARAGDPLVLAMRDPRMLWMAFRAHNAVACAVLFVMASLKLTRRRCKLVNGENLAAAFFALAFCVNTIGRAANFAVLPGPVGQEWVAEQRANEGTEVVSLVCLFTFISMTSIARAHRLAALMGAAWLGWLIVVVLSGVYTKVEMRSFELLAMLLIDGAFLTYGAYSQERLARGEFMQRHVIKAQASEIGVQSALAAGLQAIAERLCDLVLRLDDGLCICEGADAATSFFGRPALGACLNDLIESANGEHQRVRRFFDLASATSIPQCLPTTLIVAGGKPLTVNLLITDMGTEPATFIVGISGQPSMEDAAHPEISDVFTPPDAGPFVERTRSIDEGTCARGSELGSMASTLMMGANPWAVIRHLGSKEHWWIDDASLRVPLPVRILGSGGYGVVFTGVLHGEPVAVKTFREADKSGSWDSFATELRTMRRVRHSGIVSFLGATADGTQQSIILVFELISGLPLNEYLRHPREARDRYQVTLQVCAALRYLHAHKPAIVHGDLKGSNLLIEESIACPRAKLIDFGFARLIRRRSQPLGGTMEWAPPEVFREDCRPDSSADMFAFGWLAHMAMTGQPPHGGVRGEALVMAVAQMISDRRPPELSAPELSPFRDKCLALCGACLRFEASERPSAMEAHEELKSWADTPSACDMQIGASLAVSMLSTMPLSTGLRAVAATQLGSADGSSKEVQLDAFVDRDVVVRKVSGELGCATRRDAVGRSLSDLFDDGAALVGCLIAVNRDIERGALTPPLQQRFGGMRLRARDRGQQGGGEGLVVAVCVMFPGDSGVVGVKLLACEPSSALEDAPVRMSL